MPRYAFNGDSQRSRFSSPEGTGTRANVVVVAVDAEGRLLTDDARDFLRSLLDQANASSRFDELVPRRYPVLERLLVDAGPRLWVQRTTLADEPTHFDVFAADGHYLGAVRLAEKSGGIPAPVIRDGRLYGVVHDEFDVAYVVRFPLPAFEAERAVSSAPRSRGRSRRRRSRT